MFPSQKLQIDTVILPIDSTVFVFTILMKPFILANHLLGFVVISSFAAWNNPNPQSVAQNMQMGISSLLSRDESIFASSRAAQRNAGERRHCKIYQNTGLGKAMAAIKL